METGGNESEEDRIRTEEVDTDEGEEADRTPWPCLVPNKFCKIFQIFRHIESLDVCMKY